MESNLLNDLIRMRDKISVLEDKIGKIMSDEPIEDKIAHAKVLREMGISPWQLKDLFDKMDLFQQKFIGLQSTVDNLHHIMNLRTNALRNDLDDLKSDVDGLDEIIDSKY